MAIHQLINEAYQEDRKDRRDAARYPFCRRVMVLFPGGSPNPSCTAFCRDISTLGIGLLHDVALTPGEIELAIPSKRGYTVQVRVRILWCQPCGDGWYTSGGLFAGIASPKAP
jgi:hypothetical protein